MSRRVFGVVGVLAVAAGVLMGQPRTAPAQAVVVSVKSFGELLNDLDYLVGAIAPADQAQPVQQMLGQFKDPNALKGLNRERPIVAMGWLPEKEGAQPNAIVAVPTSDVNALLETLKTFGATVDENAGAPGFTHKVTPPGNPTPMYLTSNAEYAFFSLLPAGADKLKAIKPAMWVPEKAGDIGISIRFDRIPQQYKDLLLAQMDQNLAAQRQQKPDEKDADYKSRMTGMDLAENGVKSLVNEGRDLTLQLNIDPKVQEVALELTRRRAAGHEAGRHAGEVLQAAEPLFEPVPERAAGRLAQLAAGRPTPRRDRAGH